MTLQQTPERRPNKIDINLLPSEFRPVKKSKLSLILYTVIFLLVCAIVPLIIMKSGVSSDSSSLKTELASLNQQLVALQDNQNQADVIKSLIADAQDQLATAQADAQTFLDDRILWSEIITEIDDLVPGKKITLSSISTTSTTVSLPGTATKKIYAYDFIVDLEESAFFEDVKFNFGDCPDIATCSFSLTATLSNESEALGGVNE